MRVIQVRILSLYQSFIFKFIQTVNMIKDQKVVQKNILEQQIKKQDANTQDNSHPQQDKAYTYLKLKSQKMLQQIIRHHQICSKKSSTTFMADKLVRLCTNIIKVIRNYNLSRNMSPIQKLYIEIIQLRRLLRVDRFCLILRDYIGYIKKRKLSKIDYFLLFFKGLLLAADCNDARAYLIQLNILSSKQLLPILRQRVSNFYFYECIGWFFYYFYQYCATDCKQSKQRFKLIIIRYCMDCIISHNQFQYRKLTIPGKIISLIGLLSSILNLYIIWN